MIWKGMCWWVSYQREFRGQIREEVLVLGFPGKLAASS